MTTTGRGRGSGAQRNNRSGERNSPNKPGPRHYNNGQNFIANSRPNRQQQLPMSGVPYGYLPAFLPGSASLAEQLDRRVMIVLRDGRHLVGILRSFDQFSNMILEDTSERRILHSKVRHEKGSSADESTLCYYTDIQLGLYLVRGDSMVLLGEVDDESEYCDGTENQSDKLNQDKLPPQAGLVGSGLLMGGVVNLRKDEINTHMKKVTLQDFEELKKNIEEEGNSNESLNWEFDLDLVS